MIIRHYNCLKLCFIFLYFLNGCNGQTPPPNYPKRIKNYPKIENTLKIIESTGSYGRLLASVILTDINKGTVTPFFIQNDDQQGHAVHYTGELRSVGDGFNQFEVLIESSLNIKEIAHVLAHEWVHKFIIQNIHSKKDCLGEIDKKNIDIILTQSISNIKRLQHDKEKFLAAAFIFYSEAQAYEANYYLNTHNIYDPSLQNIKNLPIFIEQNYHNRVGLKLGRRLRRSYFNILSRKEVQDFWMVISSEPLFYDLFVLQNRK